MTSAGPRRLRDQLVQSANAARKIDPRLGCLVTSPVIFRHRAVSRGRCADPTGQDGLTHSS